MATIVMSITLILIGIAAIVYFKVEDRKNAHEDAE